jgi:hypothetical protein
VTYQRFPIETDPTALAQDSYALLSDKTGGVWQPSDGHLDTWVIEATARQAAEVRDVAADVPDRIFRTFGTDLVGLPPLVATSAQAVLDLILQDQASYLLPAGTTFGIDDLAGETHAFALSDDVIVAAGGGSGPRGYQVVAWALAPGLAANGIDPRPGNASLLDALVFVSSVALALTTSGGADGENDDDYMARLAGTLALLSPVPILPADFAVLALSVAGVGFAAAINLYSPGPPPATNVARSVTVVLAGPDGLPVSPTTKAAVDALLQGLREVNFLVYEVDPGYVTINVTFQVGLAAGYLGTDVVTNATAALRNYLTPSTFAAPSAGEVAGLWTPVAAVRYLDVALVLQAVEGVDHVIALTLNGGTVDITLPAPASLPKPGTVTGTAT